MEPESSIRRVVSKVDRKAYGSSLLAVALSDVPFGCDLSCPVGRMGPESAVGDGVYAGGGSFDGTVNAFMPGRSGRRVAGERFADRLGAFQGGTKVLLAPEVGP